jgi:hypothetical protein
MHKWYDVKVAVADVPGNSVEEVVSVEYLIHLRQESRQVLGRDHDIVDEAGCAHAFYFTS